MKDFLAIIFVDFSANRNILLTCLYLSSEINPFEKKIHGESDIFNNIIKKSFNSDGYSEF